MYFNFYEMIFYVAFIYVFFFYVSFFYVLSLSMFRRTVMERLGKVMQRSKMVMQTVRNGERSLININ